MKFIAMLPWDHINEAALEHNVPRALIAAITMAESAGNTFATRFEPEYKWLVETKRFAKELSISEATERVMQMTSFGLMQVMGANARESGFNDHLVRLVKPELGLKYGCEYIKRLTKKYTSQEDIISSYNQGSPVKMMNGKYKNQQYVDKVLMYFNDIRRL